MGNEHERNRFAGDHPTCSEIIRRARVWLVFFLRSIAGLPGQTNMRAAAEAIDARLGAPKAPKNSKEAIIAWIFDDNSMTIARVRAACRHRPARRS